MKKKSQKQKKKVVVDEQEIERIGGRLVEYVNPEEGSKATKTAKPKKMGR